MQWLLLVLCRCTGIQRFVHVPELRLQARGGGRAYVLLLQSITWQPAAVRYVCTLRSLRKRLRRYLLLMWLR